MLKYVLHFQNNHEKKKAMGQNMSEQIFNISILYRNKKPFASLVCLVKLIEPKPFVTKRC